MQCRILIGAPNGFLQSRQQIVMLIPVPVIAHITPLGQLLHGFQGHRHDSIPGFGCKHAQLHRIHRLAHIPPAAGSNVGHHPILRLAVCAKLLSHQPKGTLHRRLQLLRRHGLELKYSGTADDGVKHSKIGVLRGGGNQGQGTVFDVLQQALLLLLVQILDLIQIQQDSVAPCQGAGLGNDLLDIPYGGGGAVQLIQGHVAVAGNDPGKGGFPHAGWPVKNHVRHLSPLQNAAQGFPRGKQMGLSHDLVQGGGADFISKGGHRLLLFSKERANCQQFALFVWERSRNYSYNGYCLQISPTPARIASALASKSLAAR